MKFQPGWQHKTTLSIEQCSTDRDVAGWGSGEEQRHIWASPGQEKGPEKAIRRRWWHEWKQPSNRGDGILSAIPAAVQTYCCIRHLAVGFMGPVNFFQILGGKTVQKQNRSLKNSSKRGTQQKTKERKWFFFLVSTPKSSFLNIETGFVLKVYREAKWLLTGLLVVQLPWTLTYCTDTSQLSELQIYISMHHFEKSPQSFLNISSVGVCIMTEEEPLRPTVSVWCWLRIPTSNNKTKKSTFFFFLRSFCGASHLSKIRFACRLPLGDRCVGLVCETSA